MNRLHLWGAVGASMCVLALFVPFSTAATRKVIDRAQADAASLAAMHAIVLEEYESFVLVETPDETPAAGAEKSAGPRAVPGARIALRDFPIDTTLSSAMMAPDVPAQLTIADYAPETRGLYLVQFYGPIKEAWLDALKAAGAEIVEYMPEYAYVVRMTPAQRQLVAAGSLVPRGVAGRSPVQWTGVFQPAYRLSKTLVGRSGPVTTSILVIDDADGRALAERLLKEGTQVQPVTSLPPYIGFKVTLDAERLTALASDASVYFIDEWTTPVLFDEPGAMNMAGLRVNGEVSGFGLAGIGWLKWLSNRGFPSSQVPDFLVNITDTGLDKGKKTGKWHRNLYAADGITARVAYVKDWTTDAGGTNDGVDGDGHGTSCAGVVAAYDNSTGLGNGQVSTKGYHFGLGVDPFARIGGSKVFRYDGRWGLGSHTYTEVENYAYGQGARISSNSWGSSNPFYTAESREYDSLVRDASPEAGNQPMIIAFAAGNEGPYHSTAAPGNAKNVITVGAAENWWPSYRTCSWSSAIQNTPGDDIAPYSSRGAIDGRIKPDVVAIAQGWNTLRGQFVSTPDCSGGPFDTASASLYGPFNGTSAATPAVAGATSLFYRWAKSHWGAAPSAALTKAALVATARDLVGGHDNYTDADTGPPLTNAPNSSQGWGLVDLSKALATTSTLVVDQSRLLTATGQSATWIVKVADPAKPVRIVLAWTDAPGDVASYWAIKNDLDLRVQAAGLPYVGNNLVQGTSVPYGVRDSINNIEAVFLPAGTSPSVAITVSAANLVADGVPDNATSTDQDFALFVINAGVACTPPAAPTVTAVASGDNRIDLSWTAVEGATGYRILRAAGASTEFQGVGFVPATTLEWTDTGVSTGVTYHYQIVAVSSCEPAAGVAAATATGLCTLPPDAPGTPSAQDTDSSVCAIRVMWPWSVSNCGSSVPPVYEVYRFDSPSSTPDPAHLLRAGITQTSFVDQFGIVSGRPYYYLVKAVDLVPARPWAVSPLGSGMADGPSGTMTAQSTTWLPIPDGNGPPVSQSLNLTGDGIIEGVDLTLAFNSTGGIEELAITLTSPAGTQAAIGSWTAPQSLAQFQGQHAKGAWTLRADDTVGNGMVHSITSWQLEVAVAHACTSGHAAPPGEASPSGDLRVERSTGSALRLRFTPAERSADTVVYGGTHSASGWNWSRCAKNLGNSGDAIVDFSGVGQAPGTLFAYVAVGAEGVYEGSYGRDSSGRERNAAGSSLCGYVQALP